MIETKTEPLGPLINSGSCFPNDAIGVGCNTTNDTSVKWRLVSLFISFLPVTTTLKWPKGWLLSVVKYKDRGNFGKE